MKSCILITCEHGGNEIPARYSSLFVSYADVLQTHRGYDAGALLMARDLAHEFSAPLVAATVSRLLIDLNRSIGHPHLYSDATRNITKAMRADIVRNHYQPYRNEAETWVRKAVESGNSVIHISSHSFTPELHGELRRTDIGLQYDSRRIGEATLAKRWQAAFKIAAPVLVVRRNYPYNGRADGLTSHLRRHYSPAEYSGIELEINQKHVAEGLPWDTLRKTVAAALRAAISE